MSIRISKGKRNVKNYSEGIIPKLQSMPCKVYADCDAEVSKFFNNTIIAKEIANYTGSFRGYPLCGQRREVFKGYSGIVVQEIIRPETDTDERRFYVTGEFNSFMQWEWNDSPNSEKHFTQAASEWIDIAEALHEVIME